ncbi:MAG: NAD(P)-dependent oxidoreductase [Armatimonadetes bacterium]|nr:NAD(P)-dependent oxidoreductase [Armatimonadota bacterium]
MIAVTGGAGFLGFHLANHLHRKGENSAMLDIAPYVEADYPEQVRLLHADVRNLDQVRSALEEVAPDCVIHGAAALPLWKPKDIHETNVEGTRNVLQAALDLGIPRVVHISSTAVYGIPKVHPLYEDHEMVGVGPYGESKVEAERLCGQFRERGLVVPVVRPKTFIGTGRLGVFQILYDWVESGCWIPVIGDGSNHYQLLEVEDLCEAIWLCATGAEDACNDTFNVGAEEYKTVAEDVGALCEYAGSGARVMPTLPWVVKPILAVAEALKLSPLYKWVYGTADTDSYVAVDRIKERLGWSARYSNAEALIRSYQWYLDHKHEIGHGTGVTHRVAWNQGILRVFKILLSM